MCSKYQKGEVVEGRVTGIEKYGIFLAFDDDYNGLIHISELSEHFVKDVSLYATVGEKISCVILEVNDETKQLKCSIKNTEYGREKDSHVDHGFSPLKKQLPIWMDEKLREYGEYFNKKEEK